MYLKTESLEQVFDKTRIGFYLIWAAINLIGLYTLFGGVLNLSLGYVLLIGGSCAILKLKQFAGQPIQNMDNIELNVGGILEQWHQALVAEDKQLMTQILSRRTMSESLEILIPLLVASTLLASTSLSALVLVVGNVLCVFTYLKKTKYTDCGQIVENYQSIIAKYVGIGEGTLKALYDQIPKYREAKKIK